jgi:hypothetical protein
MEEKNDFRRKVLKAHYDLSGGKTLNPVLRSEVAKRLGINDYNDTELIETIAYLEDKHLLKVADNMDDQITSLGLDEVDNKFPNLGDGEVMKLSPEFYGVGINLKTAWRKIRNWIGGK